MPTFRCCFKKFSSCCPNSRLTLRSLAAVSGYAARHRLRKLHGMGGPPLSERAKYLQFSKSLQDLCVQLLTLLGSNSMTTLASLPVDITRPIFANLLFTLATKHNIVANHDDITMAIEELFQMVDVDGIGCVTIEKMFNMLLSNQMGSGTTSQAAVPIAYRKRWTVQVGKRSGSDKIAVILPNNVIALHESGK
uniref:EF-hand domain-containing protein n=1 Tax=Spongospora subterranea TaxID=70186 RepID=A0A0H5QUQ5_9EUKA|eukprot:CRZ05487.1 hypothetical protein [Spongospora subterranea]